MAQAEPLKDQFQPKDAQCKFSVALQLKSRRYSSDHFSSDPTNKHEVMVDVGEFHHEDANVSYNKPFPRRPDFDHSAIREGAQANKASQTAQEQKVAPPFRHDYGLSSVLDGVTAYNVVSAGKAELHEEQEDDCVGSYIPHTLSRPLGAGVAKAPRSPKKFGEDLPRAGSSNTFESMKADRLKRLGRKQEGSFGS
ncbi:MAG: hypothetical protein NT116_06420 [Candidatus Parcubacteria bacterium]|nr:hypothetical protein [Candidatus Parcubacteria bacterium]